jgi:hypothetical protein
MGVPPTAERTPCRTPSRIPDSRNSWLKIPELLELVGLKNIGTDETRRAVGEESTLR